MKLLIATQAVDLDDPLLAFFHRWIEEFATQCERVEVICLKEGRHRLPANVRVHSLGKERRTKPTSVADRIAYAIRFLRLAWSLRSRYDAVFVHMNEEYVLLGGLLWKLLGKRVGFERIHPYGTWRSDIAYRLSDCVFYLTPEAHSYRAKKRRPSPHGIDVDAYASVSRNAARDAFLFLGRIDPVKKVDVILDAAARAGAPVAVYGDPSPASRAYYEHLKKEHSALAGRGLVAYHPGVRHEDTPSVYARYPFFINITPSGSLDKTMLEAMASGCVVLTSNGAMRDVVSPRLFVEDGGPEALAEAMRAALAMTPDERAAEAAAVRRYVRENHAVEALVRTYLAEIAGANDRQPRARARRFR